MIERLVISNLRRAQAFDANLRSANTLQTIAAKFVEAILYNPDPTHRVSTINRLKDELIEHVTTEVFPQAQRIGTTNARDILNKLPPPRNPLTPREIQLSLFEGKTRVEQRLRIIRSTIDASGSTLDARLTRFWLEPAEGGAKQKVERLREIHNRLDGKRKTYETNIKKFNAGEIKSRPASPKLDFMPAFTDEVKKETRTQARRAGTDAETAIFKNQGHKNFVWVTVNGSVACPDCHKRQNVLLTMPEWERVGRPGSGLTICGDSCFCMLLPEGVTTVSPSLLNRVNTREPGPLTNDTLLQFLNSHRISAAKK